MDILCYIVDFTIPVMMICVGIAFLIRPPQKPNNAVGHRTKHSRLSQETWDFSQKLLAILYLLTGILFCIITATLSVYFYKIGIKGDTLWLLAGGFILVQLLGILLITVVVEKVLKSRFDEYGVRKIN